MRPIFVNLAATDGNPRYINLNCIAKIHKSGGSGKAEITYWGEVGTSRSCGSDCSFDEFMERVSEALGANK